MFLNILKFELRHRLRRPLTWVWLVIYSFFGFMGVWRASIGRGLMAAMTSAGKGNLEADAPFALYYYMTILSAFGLMIAAAWFGEAANRDFRLRAHNLFFSWPVGKGAYLGGRFAGAFAAVILVLSGMAAGGLLAAVSPLADRSGFGSIFVGAFLHPYLVAVIPNMLFAGSLFFALSLMTRKSASVWGGLAVIVVLHVMAQMLVRTGAQTVASLLDPLGIVAARRIYAYWSIAEKNATLLPLSGMLLANRLLWVSAGLLVGALSWSRFRMTVPEEAGTGGSSSLPAASAGRAVRRMDIASKLKVSRSFSSGDYLRRSLAVMVDDLRYLGTQTIFYVLIALGLALVLFTGFRGIGVVRGTQTFPVTSQVLTAFTSNLYFLGLITTLYCSSVLLWRKRSWNVHEILDAIPLPGWVPLLGLAGAMVVVHALLLLLVMGAGIAVQAARNFYDFQISLYLTELFGVQLVYYSLISVFALFAQVLTGKKLAGFIVTLFFVDEFMIVMGLEHNLWTFAARPAHIISDMNGYGPFASAITTYDFYWAFSSVILIVLASWLYPRGLDISLKQRLKGVRERLSRKSLAVATAGAAGCLIVGGIILYNTMVLNDFETEKAADSRMAEYEKTYKRWERAAQPDVTGIESRVDIYPDQRRCSVHGSIRLENRTAEAIDTLFVQVPGRPASLGLSISRPAVLVHEDLKHGVYLYELEEPLRPGDEGEIVFDLEIVERGFRDRDVNTRLVRNGTFLTAMHLFPAPGYDPYGLGELRENDDREKQGLPPAPRMKPADDAEARNRLPFSSHAGWIDFEAVVSTSAGQTALATGELVNEWEEGGRRFFHYRAPGRILRYVAFISGEYEVLREEHNGTSIEIYHHPGHPYNVDLMARSVKASLDYFGDQFSPYQFPTIRLVEFPKYEMFAEAFPGLIPISEGYGFIAKYDEGRLKEAFRVVAHEVGHQWWAHQVVGADVEGFFMLTEVMAQYSALVVSKREYAREVFDGYVLQEMRRYLGGRGAEVVEEVPLVRTNEATWYQHYSKGFVVMNALAELVGEEAINGAIRQFVERNAFKEAPYPVAAELVDLFRDAAPDSMLYLVEDSFDRIVIFDNEAVSARSEPDGGGRFRVELMYEIRKWNVDGSGEETEAGTRDLVEFAVFGSEGRELCRERRWVEGGEGEIVMLVDALPESAGVDPHYLLVDRNAENNRIDVVHR